MKQILLTLCVFFFLIMSVNAGELYRCTDSYGKTIITDNPQNGMKNCEYIETQSPEEPAIEKKEIEEKKDDAAAKDLGTSPDRINRIRKCIICCNEKIDSCYNYTADSRLCMAENQKCASMCKSEGSSPSSWSDCWSQSGK